MAAALLITGGLCPQTSYAGEETSSFWGDASRLTRRMAQKAFNIFAFTALTPQAKSLAPQQTQPFMTSTVNQWLANSWYEDCASNNTCPEFFSQLKNCFLYLDDPKDFPSNATDAILNAFNYIPATYVAFNPTPEDLTQRLSLFTNLPEITCTRNTVGVSPPINSWFDWPPSIQRLTMTPKDPEKNSFINDKDIEYNLAHATFQIPFMDLSGAQISGASARLVRDKLGTRFLVGRRTAITTEELIDLFATPPAIEFVGDAVSVRTLGNVSLLLSHTPVTTSSTASINNFEPEGCPASAFWFTNIPSFLIPSCLTPHTLQWAKQCASHPGSGCGALPVLLPSYLAIPNTTGLTPAINEFFNGVAPVSHLVFLNPDRDDLPRLAGLKSLASLRIQNDTLDDSWLPLLAAINPQFEKLSLRPATPGARTGITDKGIASLLAGNRVLRSLDLTGSKISDASFPLFVDLINNGNLNALFVEDTHFSVFDFLYVTDNITASQRPDWIFASDGSLRHRIILPPRSQLHPQDGEEEFF